MECSTLAARVYTAGIDEGRKDRIKVIFKIAGQAEKGYIFADIQPFEYTFLYIPVLLKPYSFRAGAFWRARADVTGKIYKNQIGSHAHFPGSSRTGRKVPGGSILAGLVSVFKKS